MYSGKSIITKVGVLLTLAEEMPPTLVIKHKKHKKPTIDPRIMRLSRQSRTAPEKIRSGINSCVRQTRETRNRVSQRENYFLGDRHELGVDLFTLGGS
jgi:hypothetical protein